MKIMGEVKEDNPFEEDFESEDTFEEDLWIEIDEEKKQYGKKIGKYEFEFIQGDLNSEDCIHKKIDISGYPIDKIEDYINNFGYTLLPIYEDELENIYYVYEEEADFTIAECIFRAECE